MEAGTSLLYFKCLSSGGGAQHVLGVTHLISLEAMPQPRGHHRDAHFSDDDWHKISQAEVVMGVPTSACCTALLLRTVISPRNCP